MSQHQQESSSVIWKYYRNALSSIRDLIQSPNGNWKYLQKTIVSSGLIFLACLFLNYCYQVFSQTSVLICILGVSASSLIFAGFLKAWKHYQNVVFVQAINGLIAEYKSRIVAWVGFGGFLLALMWLLSLLIDPRGGVAHLLFCLVLFVGMLGIVSWFIEVASKSLFSSSVTDPKNRTPFAPSGLVTALLTVGSLGFCFLVLYPLLIHYSFFKPHGLVQSYRQCNVYSELLQSDPNLRRVGVNSGGAKNAPPIPFPDLESHPDEVLLRILVGFGLYPKDSTIESVKNDDKFVELRYYIAKIQNDKSKNSYSLFLHSNDTRPTTLEVIKLLVGNNQNVTNDRVIEAMELTLSGHGTTNHVWIVCQDANSQQTGNLLLWFHRFFDNFWAMRPLHLKPIEPENEILYRLNSVYRSFNSRNSSSGNATTPPDSQQSDPKRLRTLLEELQTANATPNGEGANERIPQIEREIDNWTYSDFPENREFLQQFLTESLARTHSSPMVKSAWRDIRLFLGWEQLAMMSIFVLAIGLLGARIACSRVAKSQLDKSISTWSQASDDQTDATDQWLKLNGLANLTKVNWDSLSKESFEDTIEHLQMNNHNSRWLLKWLLVALPAIGFIGTVRGISAGLSNSDSIVRATSQVEQAAAITSVSGQLGIAFTTTLIALILGLVLGIFERFQSRLETADLLELERNGKNAIAERDRNRNGEANNEA